MLSQDIILFELDDGRTAFCIPAPAVDPIVSGKKCTPKGRPFVIVNTDELPEDNSLWAALKVDYTDPDGVGEQA